MTLLKNTFTSLLVLAILALHPSLNKGDNPITYLQYLVYGNSIHLSYDNTIIAEKINVKWECENPNINCIELTIIKDGKQINKIPFEKGNQQLVVYYDNKIVGHINQHKLIEEQAHQYNVELSANSKVIYFNGEIAGPSPSSYSQTNENSDLTIAKL